MITKKLLIVAILTLLSAGTLTAQESQEEISIESEDQLEDLSVQLANPLADLISFPFQNNLNIDQGEFNRNVNVLNFQPVIPFAGGKLITRTIIPFLRIPDFGNESGKLSSGLGDIGFTAFYVPESKGIKWGFGPIVELPTGGSLRGTEKWSAGPSLVVLTQPGGGDWSVGAVLNNVWSFAGKSNRGDVNRGLINLFIVRQIGDGWYVNSAPIITADWTADSENRWTVPLGAGGGKLVMLGGKLPINLQTQLYYNVVRPDFGPKMQWRFQVQTVIPKSMFK